MRQDTEAVIQVVEGYFMMLYTADRDMAERLFLPWATVNSCRDGQVVSVDLRGFQDRMSHRPVPRDLGEEQVHRVETLDFAGPGCAFVKLRSVMLGKLFIDYLTLLKVSGEWKIISKTFHEQADPYAPGVTAEKRPA